MPEFIATTRSGLYRPLGRATRPLYGQVRHAAIRRWNSDEIAVFSALIAPRNQKGR
jgi:hypothetical protein